MCVSVYVCVNEIERQKEGECEQEGTVGRGIKHSSLIQHNLSGTTSQYHNISHIYVSQIWQWQPSLQISGVISALRTGCCRTEIQFATAQMGEAIASVPQYRMQKCLVCFNTDKADILWGVSQTIPMKEQSPIWQCSLSEILSVMLSENWRQNILCLYISPYQGRTLGLAAYQQNITPQARTSPATNPPPQKILHFLFKFEFWNVSLKRFKACRNASRIHPEAETDWMAVRHTNFRAPQTTCTISWLDQIDQLYTVPSSFQGTAQRDCFLRPG